MNDDTVIMRKDEYESLVIAAVKIDIIRAVYMDEENYSMSGILRAVFGPKPQKTAEPEKDA